jgi:hypothetical protein
MDNISTFLLAQANTPFLVSACLLGAILVLEIIGLILGFSSFHHDIDFSADLNGNGIPDYLEVDSHILGWFNPGSVPVMIFLVIFSTVFTILGYSAQWVYEGLTGAYAPMLLSCPIVFSLTLPFVRWGSIVAAQLMPRDITSAVSLESLSNLSGPIVVGPVSNTQSGSIRVTDQYGTDHYVYVFADGEENIDVGETAVLTGPHRSINHAHMVRKI